MIQLQLISKILNSKDISVLENNLIDRSYFLGYEAEYDFIMNHYKQYGNVPDVLSFLSQFPDDQIVEVTESDEYLVDTIREELLYHKAVPVVEKAAALLKTDANKAAEYMINSIKSLQPTYRINGVDIVSQADQRLNKFIERQQHQDEWFFTSGFQELDGLWHGIQRGEEFIVIVARTNQGKTWILEKMITHVWQIGFNVGLVSPEISATNVGYRFDTLHKNFSNKGLMWGKEDISEEEYRKYIEELKQQNNKFLVTTSTDFDRRITVSKLRAWVTQSKLDFLAIDGITYLSDERGKKSDNKNISLTNISEDLRLLSLELGIPIVVVVQANRGGVKQDDEDGTPEIEHIRDSDGISHNATKVLSIRQLSNGVLEMVIKKNTFGSVGGKLKYQWNIDIGDFQYIPSYDSAESTEKTEKRVRDIKKKYNDVEDVF